MIRPARMADLAFVMSAWLKSYADSDTALLATPRDDEHTRKCEACGAYRVRTSKGGAEYFRGHRALVMRLLSQSTTTISENDTDGLIDGFATIEQKALPLVHYVYVRLSARKRGVAKALLASVLESPQVVYSHRSRSLDAKRLPPGWRFDPYVLFPTTPEANEDQERHPHV